MLAPMANQVHMIYALTAEQRAEIQERGEELPAVRIVHKRAVPRLESAGFVVCDKDGNPIESEPDQGNGGQAPAPVGGFNPGATPGEGDDD